METRDMSAETLLQSRPAFSVRIVVCDHYSTKPIPGVDVIYSEFRGSDIKQVPVLRIFGSAADGHKVCLHVHGVFPYFYVPCPVSNPEPQFLYQMAASLDKALNIAMKQAMSANQHVYKITLVKGLPFYGFHDKEHLYLKVFLYNPGLIKQAVDLCNNGAILGQTFQPHEAHLNFTLQFFIDFNLFGMSNMDLQSVSFRKKPGTSQNSDDPLDDDSYLKPESICYYEVDCSASHIINRQRIGKEDGIENPGLEEVWKQEQRRRQELNMSMASKSLSQGRLKAEETESHYKFQQMCLIKMSNEMDKPVDVGNETSPIIEVSYPAESLEGSQLLKAVDVSVHLPVNSSGISLSETLRNNDTTVEDLDNTLVDESVALNSSLHYSQVLLDSEDLDLVDMLQDLDEKRQAVEEDSVLSTRTEREDENDDHYEAEYSQIFNEETIIGDPYKNKDDVSESSPSWNDSFWEDANIPQLDANIPQLDANIPQLDGTFDDDHVKKVRKRKMRPLKLGLSKPKSKKNMKSVIKEDISSIDITDSDEINVSREIINSISSLHLKKAVKDKGKNILENVEDRLDSQISNESITDLVNKAIAKYENGKTEISETYDLQNKYKPVAGPSTCNKKKTESESNCDINESNNESFESSAGHNDLGFISFYNASKLFDASLDEKNQTMNLEVPKNHEHIDAKMEIQSDHSIKVENCDTKLESLEDDMKLYYSETPLITHSKIFPVRLCSSIISSLVLTPKFRPPTKSYIASTLKRYNIPQIRHAQPFCSNHKDVGEKVEIGQVIIKLHSHRAQDQKPFGKVLDTTSIEEWRQLMFLQNNYSETSKPESLKTLLASNRQCILEPVRKPPTTRETMKWVESVSEEKAKIKEQKKSTEKNEVTNIIDDLDNSQAIGLNEFNNSISLESIEKEQNNLNESLQVTMQPDGSFLCFGSAQKESQVSDSPGVEMNFLTVMVCEVHTDVRGDLNPDPLIDQIQAVFISVINDCPLEHFLEKSITEIIVVDDMTAPKKFDRCSFKNITYVNNESDVIGKVIELIQKHDPDIMCGYEIEMCSWGYILERSQVLGLEVIMEISRITEKCRQKRSRSEEKSDFEGRIIGRVLFNVWRLFRHELALSSYSFENCMYEVLKERVPKYSFAQLSAWWNDESRILRWIPVEFYLTRLSGTVRMLEKLDIINRTAELARLFGIQWWEVLTRGSQFRVESLMLRAARAHNLLALSPSVQQRAAMPAPATLPLIYEPESRFYADPVIVLDFQSLYPSMMIAYNYCFSTCIGKLDNITGDAPYPFGAWKLRISKQRLSTLTRNNLVHWSPTGAGFVRADVRRGVLPALLRRILAARQAVKTGMKRQTDEGGRKAMHSRQLGLKLIANVTYGYTAANFSGRMPCVEVADSVVAKGRETLERAIKLVENGDWNVKVVYGDTDSMFVLAAGRSRADAFRIGQQIADAVTADNPSPVALKLEKVYQPCILQTKKRYVGFMYESETAAPVYEAKGIETVRRDGCPAAVKLLQRSLVELFTSGDMSAVKLMVTSQLARLAAGAVPPQDLLFTREYHGAAGYRPGAAAPPHEIAKYGLIYYIINTLMDTFRGT